MSSNLLFIDSIVGHEKAPFFTALFVSGLLFLASLLALRGLKKAKEPEIPSSGLSSRTFFHAFKDNVLRFDWMMMSTVTVVLRRWRTFVYMPAMATTMATSSTESSNSS